MRSLGVKSLLSVVLILALAPMQVAADLPSQYTGTSCNVGTVTNPLWVACQGAYSINAPDGYPNNVDQLLSWMLVRDYWQPEDVFTDEEWETYSEVIETWDSDSYSKTEFGNNGLPQGADPGPFASFLKVDGAWTLTFAAPFNPYWGIFAILLKQAGEYSVFLFDVDQNPGVSAIRFDGAYWGGDALSHAGLFGGESTTVPEPSSLLLLGSGLLGLGFVGYRRRRK